MGIALGGRDGHGWEGKAREGLDGWVLGALGPALGGWDAFAREGTGRLE